MEQFATITASVIFDPNLSARFSLVLPDKTIDNIPFCQ
jgi:hypothetical protein